MKSNHDSQLSRGRCAKQPKQWFKVVADEAETEAGKESTLNDEQRTVVQPTEKQTDTAFEREEQNE
jgi:hypothetical protein